MKSIFNLLLLMTVILTCQATPTPKASGDSIKVYVFLHESCKISQFYTLKLNELYAKYQNQSIEFVGIFPNTSSKPENIAAFKEKYHISFELKTDYEKGITERFGAKITPEVVVYDEQKEQILYKGRIDNSYARLGRRRNVTTSSELGDVLEAIANCNPIFTANTDAIGCFINMKKLSIP